MQQHNLWTGFQFCDGFSKKNFRKNFDDKGIQPGKRVDSVLVLNLDITVRTERLGHVLQKVIGGPEQDKGPECRTLWWSNVTS